MHNLKWKQPKSPLQIVVLVEGEIEGRVSIASTASEYPLAIFGLGNPPPITSLQRYEKVFVLVEKMPSISHGCPEDKTPVPTYKQTAQEEKRGLFNPN